MDLQTFDYDLPENRIAQFPASPRDHSKLLKLNRNTSQFEDHIFHELPSLLREGDVLVINETRVLPARMKFGKLEILIVTKKDARTWDTMIFPGKSFKPGTLVLLSGGLSAQVLSRSEIGRILEFNQEIEPFLEKHGEMPIPPYISRHVNADDIKTYQTVYAKVPGSVAAPTAGLHFTESVLAELQEKKVEVVRLTLHVGPGTFRPVKDADITKHRIYPEYYACSSQTWNKIVNAKRVIAVGTTTTRALEAIALTGELEGYSDLFIYPGFEFKIIGAMITNFHLPKSSLLMLVSAFAGTDLILKTYRHAINSGYRFYSYGDAMLIL